MKVDWLIIGAGFTGAVIAERIATQLDKKVLIVDRRNHIGGNAYDYYNKQGVLVHKYGPHIFHTNSQMVWEYLSQFTEWRPYFHRVLAMVDGIKVPIPINLNSLYKLFPPKYAGRLEDVLINSYGYGTKVPILKLLKSTDGEMQFLANYIYEKVFYNYTLKQWEFRPEDLDESVTGRVPVYISRDDRYFQDRYQGIPKHGYAALFKRMLFHPNIKILLNTDYQEIEDAVSFNKMIFTGPIDEYFNYLYGPLPYRSLRFKSVNLGVEWHQEVGTVNYPNEYDYTRITEQKHLTGQQYSGTTLIIEYPQAYKPGKNDPYYPIPRSENQERYLLYAEEARKLKNTVLFAGRLADYKYYNMDQAVARAIHVFKGIAS